MSGRSRPGAVVRRRELETITGARVAVPEPGGLVHLQFRRFAGCPVCNLHLRSVVMRHEEIEASGVREVVLFHSSAEELRVHAPDLPFAVVADPRKRLYREFGVEAGPRALLNPRAWVPIVRAVARDLDRALRERNPLPSLRPEGGRLGLPADFLVDGDGRIVACRYGEHAYDQWSVDTLLALAAQARATQRPSAFSVVDHSSSPH